MCSRSAKNEILKFYINSGEDIWITVHGPSMFPILQENNIIHIRKIEKIRIGNIIVFSFNNVLVVHRIIRVNEQQQTVTTMGDDVPTIDENIPFNDILGEVDLFAGNNGKVYNMNDLKLYNFLSTKLSIFISMFTTEKEEYKISNIFGIKRSKLVMWVMKKIYNWELEKKTNEEKYKI